MKKSILLILMIVMTLTTNSFSQESNRLTYFFNTAEQLREVSVLLRIKENVPERREEAELKLADAFDKAEKLQSQNTLCDDGILVYLKGMANYFQDIPEIETVEVFLSEIKSPMEGESLEIVHRWTNAFNRQKQLLHYDHTFQPNIIIPIRNTGSLLKYDRLVPPAHFPSYSSSYHSLLPYQFKALGLYDKAWKSFFEGLDPVSFMNNDQRSTETSVHWQEAADCAYRAGEKRLGWNLLMKAAVFGDENTLEGVKETATLWLDCEENNKELPQIPWYYSGNITDGMKRFEKYIDSLNKNWDTESRIVIIELMFPDDLLLRDAMLRRIGEPGFSEKEIRHARWDHIIDTYMKMKAHPRAWALIDEYPEEFENPEELKKKVQDDWLDLVGGLIQACEFVREKKAEVYGQVLIQKVSDDEDFKTWNPGHGLLLRKDSEDENGNATFIYGYPIELRKEGELETGKATFSYPVAPLDVTIPWAFPEGSVEKAKQELRNILDEFRQAGEVSP